MFRVYATVWVFDENKGKQSQMVWEPSDDGAPMDDVLVRESDSRNEAINLARSIDYQFRNNSGIEDLPNPILETLRALRDVVDADGKLTASLEQADVLARWANHWKKNGI